MGKQEISYIDAVTELETIVQAIENDEDVDVDNLIIKIKRAQELVLICETKLQIAKENSEKILNI